MSFDNIVLDRDRNRNASFADLSMQMPNYLVPTIEAAVRNSIFAFKGS
jgi:hypothetical protein